MHTSEKEITSRHGMNATPAQHRIIPMTPAEERELVIRYTIHNSSYGPLLIASSARGILFTGFGEEEQLLGELRDRFPAALITSGEDPLHRHALARIEKPYSEDTLSLHLKGTAFQLAVWEELLQIPCGKTTSYAMLAQKIGHPASSRAVGNAVGRNPIACLIPCHRVLRSDKQMGGYHWGMHVKVKLLEAEAALSFQSTINNNR